MCSMFMNATNWTYIYGYGWFLDFADQKDILLKRQQIDIFKLNKKFYVNFSLKMLPMNSRQSEYGFWHGTQLIRCIFYIPENLEECILVMHTINLDHPFYIIGNNHL